VTVADLKTLIAEGWRCQAPAELTSETAEVKLKKGAKKTAASPRKRESRSR